MENEITPHKEAKLNPRRSVGSVPIMTMPQHWDANTRQSVANIIGKDATVAGEMQKTVQVYIIEYPHYEKDHRMRKQFACQSNVNGIVTHSQPFTGSAVFDFYTDRINGNHER